VIAAIAFPLVQLKIAGRADHDAANSGKDGSGPRWLELTVVYAILTVISLSSVLVGLAAFLASFLAPWAILWPCGPVLLFGGIAGFASELRRLLRGALAFHL
jgi:hypothetical protein